MQGTRSFIDECLKNWELEEGLDVQQILSDLVGAGLILGAGYGAYKGAKYLARKRSEASTINKIAKKHVARLSPKQFSSAREKISSLKSHEQPYMRQLGHAIERQIGQREKVESMKSSLKSIR
jgi:NADH dehydrogenase FAD-containing subunit